MIRVRAMTAADVSFGLRLREQAGWNQTEADWLRFLEMEPTGCFVVELDGEPAGAVTTCRFGPVAWISALVVDQSLRKRGLGTALMEHALTYAEEQGARTIRLDATPLGQPIYEKLGFVRDYDLAGYVGRPLFGARSDRVRPATIQDLSAIVALDWAATGAERQKLLSRLLAQRTTDVRVVEHTGRVAGYLMVRPGALAWRVGPCVGDTEAGQKLVKEMCHRRIGLPVYIDIPLDLKPGIELADAMGLRELRRFVRISRGAPIREQVDQLWCSSGPEMG